MATYLRITAPVTLLICLQLISPGKVCATLQPDENLSRGADAFLSSKSPVALKTIQFQPPPPKPDRKSPTTTEAGGGR
jgi:hypothetical protein